MRTRLRVLFVCGQNRRRSPTAARLYQNDRRVEARAAGLSPASRRRITAVDVAWADLILIMETEHRSRLASLFPDLDLPPVASLDIPDDYGFMAPDLVDLIRAGVEPHLERWLAPGGDRGAGAGEAAVPLAPDAGSDPSDRTTHVVTAADLRDGLAALGLGPGWRIMVHSSLSAFGRVEGGALAVISALMDLVTPEGTILMPSFNHGRPFCPGGPGLYDPRVTPTSNGIIPDTFWRLPNVVRSLNPTHPFASWGRDARRYLEGHHLTLTMGEGSPLGRLAQDGGWQVHLGTSHATTTAKHLAETMRRVPCLGYRTEAYPVRLPDGRVAEHRTWGWRSASCPLTESGDLIEAEMTRRGWQRRGQIGNATITVFRLQDLLAAVWALLEHGWGPYPPCTGCPIRPRQVAATRPSDWVEPARP